MHPFKPQVFVGEFHGWKLFWLEVLKWGRMFNFHPPKPAYPGGPWALDNGAFGAWVNNKPWDSRAYIQRVKVAEEMRRNEPPEFAVIPDLPGQGFGSLNFSQVWLNDCCELPLSWTYALALQDGMTVDMVDAFLRRGSTRQISTLFLGGTDEFKATAAQWSDYCHEHKLRFHYARCGSVEKLRLAVEADADSVDSVGIIRNERRDNSFWRYAMEWWHPTAQFQWKRCREMADV